MQPCDYKPRPRVSPESVLVVDAQIVKTSLNEYWAGLGTFFEDVETVTQHKSLFSDVVSVATGDIWSKVLHQECKQNVQEVKPNYSIGHQVCRSFYFFTHFHCCHSNYYQCYRRCRYCYIQCNDVSPSVYWFLFGSQLFLYFSILNMDLLVLDES